MRIEHIAIWSKDMERLRDFYIKYFGAKSNDKYMNEKKGFSSYFLSFDSGCRIEVMQKPNLISGTDDRNETYGYAHLALSVGDKDDVLKLTERLEADGYTIASKPRFTGDGYFESAVLDPDYNMIEITTD